MQLLPLFEPYWPKGIKKMTYSADSYLKSLLVLLLTVSVSGCAFTRLPNQSESCKIRAYVDNSFVDYLSQRFESENIPRVAIVPFDVPENFTPPMNPMLRFGHKLAQSFQQEFLARSESIIIEMFLRDWPGKRLDFSAGNFQAIKQARDAGYDFVFVGFMEEMVNDLKMRVHTKLIDTDSGITIWYGTTDVSSNARSSRQLANILTVGAYAKRDDLFEMEPRIDELAVCTTARIFQVGWK